MYKTLFSGETFTCVEAGCHKTFVTQSDLLKHTKTHLGQKDFICEVEGCKKEYSTAHHLKVSDVCFVLSFVTFSYLI